MTIGISFRKKKSIAITRNKRRVTAVRRVMREAGHNPGRKEDKMYKLKSAIILKDRVFIPDYDSHENMLKELGIDDTKDNEERLFVRAELSPENGDVFSSIDTWFFKVDQDIVPDWFVMEYDKKRMIEAVKSWAKYRIYVGVDNLFILTGNNYHIKDCTNVQFVGNSHVDAYGKSCIEVYGESSVTAHDIRRVDGLLVRNGL